jgi:hypothetical protein
MTPLMPPVKLLTLANVAAAPVPPRRTDLSAAMAASSAAPAAALFPSYLLLL